MKALGFAAITVIASLGLVGCNPETEAKRIEDQERWEEMLNTYGETKKELQEKYKAIVFPAEQFENQAVFTYNLQQYLTAADKPILFKGIVDDITNENNDFVIHTTTFFSKYPSVDGRRLLVRIRGNRKDVMPLLDQSPKKDEVRERYCNCALRGPLVYFVVKIKTVTKVQDGLKREAYGYGAEDTSLYEAMADLVALERLPD